MKKSELKQLVKEILLETKGYSKYYPGGKTPGLTSKTLNQILLNIAKSEEPYEGDPDKGNKILDTANQDNVDKILRGEDPHISRMQELAGVKNEVTVDDSIYEDGPITIYQSGGEDVNYYEEDFYPEDSISEEEDEKIMKIEWIKFLEKIKLDPKFREDIYNEMAEYTGSGEIKFRKGL